MFFRYIVIKNKIFVYPTIMQDFSQTGFTYPALYFVAVDWCGYCRRATPLMEEVASRLGSSLPVIHIDGDAHKGFINGTLGGVQSYPTILYMNTIGQVTKFEDERSFESIMNFVCQESSKVEGPLEACEVL
jgi:thiol-disulfide isomerase/thioredoxin